MIGWSIDIIPKKAGWYLCTIENIGKRSVMPFYCNEHPEGNFYWTNKLGKIIAICPFPEPYDGESREEIVKDVMDIFGGVG